MLVGGTRIAQGPTDKTKPQRVSMQENVFLVDGESKNAEDDL